MNKTLGILGDGQLALYLAQSAVKFGWTPLVYSETGVGPAAQHYTHTQPGQSLKDFFHRCHCVILESEFHHPDLLESLERETNVPVFPHLPDYRKVFSKLKQRKFFLSLNLPMLPALMVERIEDLDRLDFDGPYMVKVSHGGYDGYGNTYCHSRAEVKACFKGEALIVEKFIALKHEYACLVVNFQPHPYFFPVVKTIQKNQVCIQASCPSLIAFEEHEQIKNIMQTFSQVLTGPGIYCIEFFADSQGGIWINEIAPRVHNSYHLSMDAMTYSQFDLAVMCATKRDSMPENEFLRPVVMMNLLGDRSSHEFTLNLPPSPPPIRQEIYWYDKKMVKVGRKMGHVNFSGAALEILLDECAKKQKEYKI